MKVEIFSDIACPFCFIGKRNFEQALAGFESTSDSEVNSRSGDPSEPVEILWRSFQLDPDRPAEAEGDAHDHLVAKYGISREEAKVMTERVIASGREAGIEFDPGRARPANTFDAHRMMHLAATEGAAGEMAELLFNTYFDGENSVADPDTLVELAVDAGIAREAAVEVARGDRFGDEVRRDREEAESLGLNAVPAFVIDHSLLVSGAQPSEVILGALNQAAEAAATPGA